MSRQLKYSILSALFITAALVVTACSQEQSKTQTQPVADRQEDDGHGLHTIDYPRLREMMDDLRALSLPSMSRQTEAGLKPEEIKKVADAAASLAADARVIPILYKQENASMSEESRRVFDQLAFRMQEQCKQLGDLAGQNQADAIRSKVDEIITTCNACHASFRGSSFAMAGRWQSQ